MDFNDYFVFLWILRRRCDITDTNNNTGTIRIVSIVLASVSLIIPFIIFYKTMAATLSFWDCGEFIAAANILGNPHPPGTPFFVIIGRFAILVGSLFGMSAEKAVSTNFISVLSSAFTAFVLYFMIVRVSQRMPFGEKGSEFLGQLGIRIGAFSSALIMAFSSTFWFNAVETEAYGLSMFLMMLSIHLAINRLSIWHDKNNRKITPRNDFKRV